MRTLREYLWLWIGIVVAVTVSALGLGTRLAAVLGGWVPLPWGGIGIGMLIFVAMSAFHFRSHWVSCLQALGAEKQRTQSAAQLLAEVRMDGSNGARVIKENLDLVAGGSQRPQEAELYLQGAQAHAAKLEQVFERLEGIRMRLDTSTDD